jgi:hypothetical protein
MRWKGNKRRKTGAKEGEEIKKQTRKGRKGPCVGNEMTIDI